MQLPSHNIALETESQFLEDVLSGLSSIQKSIPSKYFYDERGSTLFDEITRLEEYYPTRTERGIMEASIEDIAKAIGRNSVLIEYGSGSSQKTRLLLDALPDLTAYIPIDISAEHLETTAERLRLAYPNLPVEPVAADYTGSFELPSSTASGQKRVVYFPGSTIGNFTPSEAVSFLRGIHKLISTNGGLLLGIDRKKDLAPLELAYNDVEGVTAAFNLNVLQRINAELDGSFDLSQFEHKAFFNVEDGRMEMHLVSLDDQVVFIGDESFAFVRGETIHTENSYKFDLDDARGLAEASSLSITHHWSDPQNWFSILYLTQSEKA